MPSPSGHSHGHGHGHSHTHRDAGEMLLQHGIKNRISTIMLEAAVAIHSVIIGIALGVSDAEFVSLWVALCFHQCFEGMGLGFRIADVKSVCRTSKDSMGHALL